MSIVIADPLGTTSNSYVTVARADEILRLHPYTDTWDLTATALPNADGYLVNGAVSAGASAVAIDGGSGTWSVGTEFSFAGHTTTYTVSEAQEGAGSLSFAPALTTDVADDEALTRITPNKKEQCVIWTTTLFDRMLIYYGTKKTLEQRLRAPRYGMLDPDGNLYDDETIPEPLEEATAYMASLLAEKDRTAIPAALGLGVSHAQLGPMEARIDAAQQEEIIPDYILSILSNIARLEPEAQVGTRVLGLFRS